MPPARGSENRQERQHERVHKSQSERRSLVLVASHQEPAPDGCWDFDKYTEGHCPVFWLDGKSRTASRVAFYLTCGWWPESKPFTTCGRMESCIAPHHCFAGEPRERPAPVPTRNIVTDRSKAIAMGLTERGEADVEP